MKKLVLKLNIVYLLTFLGVGILLFFGLKTLQERYLIEAAGNNMEIIVSERATTINSLVSEDYSAFDSLITDIYAQHTSTKEISDELATRVDELDYSDDIKVGYRTSEGLYLDDVLYVYNEDYDYIYHQNKSVIIYNLDDIIRDTSDHTNYIYFAKNDVFIYFSTSIYLESIIDASSIPENYYLLCETDGNVVYQKNIDSDKTSFIIDYVSGQNIESVKSIFFSAFDETGANNFLLTFDGVSSVCVYSPVLSDVNSTLLLMYIVNQDDAIASVNTLNVLLIIVFASIFVIFFVMCGIFILIIARKDKDVTAMSLGYLFSKPFIMKVSRNGKIRNYNSACYMFIYNMKKIKSILQFEFVNNSDDILDVIRKQEPFVIKTKDKNNQDMYIRMIPMKGIGYFRLVGDDFTKTIKENQRLSDIALYNSVTGLPNKYILTEKLNQLIASKEVFRSNYVLVAIDILHFVKINNLFGFSAADKMLEDVADILKSETKDMNVEIYNIRTSNFVLLFKKVSVPEDIIKWGQVALKALEKPIEIRERYLTSVETKMGI
ncbi:MAG: diguanylate cyclase, partial [Bacilli bacterium]